MLRASFARAAASARALTILSLFALMTFGAAPAQALGHGVLDAAMSMTGMHERGNRNSIRARIGVDPARTPWCGFFMGYAVKAAGRRPPPGYGRAVSWKRYGRAVSLSSAPRGAVVVIRTKRGHHVGALHSRSGGRVCLVGGNQSNRVKVSCYASRSVAAVRV